VGLAEEALRLAKAPARRWSRGCSWMSSIAQVQLAPRPQSTQLQALFSATMRPWQNSNRATGGARVPIYRVVSTI